jgi:hypothetical protein
MNSLRITIEDDEAIMPAITLNISVPESAKAKNIHFRKENIFSAKIITLIVSDLTDYDDETIVRKFLCG